MNKRKSRLAAFCCFALVAMLGCGPVVAQTILVDDFSDGLDAWSLVDTAADEDWGPGILGINGKDEFVLASRRPVPTESGSGLVVAIWDEGVNDPQYSEGTLRARLRVEEEATLTGLLMRATGSLATGFNNYSFSVGPGTRGTNYCIDRTENTQFVDGECVNSPILFGEDVYLEASAVGDQLSLKFWPVGEPEPTEPQVAWTDNHYSAGTLSLYAGRGDAQGDFFFDSNFAAVYDDLTFTPAVRATPADAVPEPTCVWLAALSCAMLVVSRRRRRKTIGTVLRPGSVAATTPALRQNLVCRQVPMLLVCVMLVTSSIQESGAQVVFDLGTFIASSEDPNEGTISLAIPAGKYNSYAMTTDFSKVGVDPWSEESIWAISNGPLYAPDTTIFVDPGPAPNFIRSSDPVTLAWSGMLDLPLTGPLDVQLLPYQAYDEPDRNFDARWANTVLELSYVTPPAPPRIDMDLGVVTSSFSHLVVDTLAADFDTELGVYSADTGQLIAHNDDVMRSDIGLRQSEVDFHLGLPDGDYLAVVGGFNTLFDDDFVISPGSVGGNYTLSAAGVSTMGSLATDQVAYIGFTVGTVGAECDFNLDASCDINDLHALLLEGPIALGVAVVPGENDELDVTSDGVINNADVGQWLADAASANGFAEPYLKGDTNLDGTVSAADLNNLALNWRAEALIWSSGDFNGDGNVNAIDLNDLALNWGQSIPMASALNSAVPEPSAWLLTIVGLALIGGRRIRG